MIKSLFKKVSFNVLTSSQSKKLQNILKPLGIFTNLNRNLQNCFYPCLKTYPPSKIFVLCHVCVSIKPKPKTKPGEKGSAKISFLFLNNLYQTTSDLTDKFQKGKSFLSVHQQQTTTSLGCHAFWHHS